MPDSQLPLYNIPLEIFNVGLGPALNTKITWKFEHIPELINSFNELGLNIILSNENMSGMRSFNILIGNTSHGFPYYSMTPVRKIEYILPYSNIESEKKIFLPPIFSLFISLSLTTYSLSEKNNYPVFPLLTGFMEYSDLSETNHKSEFEVELIPALYKKIENIDYEDGFHSATISFNIKKKKNKLNIRFNKMFHKVSNFERLMMIFKKYMI